MKKLPALGLMVLLLLGCTAQRTYQSANETAKVVEAGPEPKNATGAAGSINLSISRNASGVLNTDTVFPEVVKFDFSNRTTPDGRLAVYYFFSPYCVASKAIGPEIDKLEAKYPKAAFLRYDITTKNGSLAYQDFAGQFNLSTKQRLVPQVLVNGTILTDRFNINNTLGGILQNFTDGFS
jgi:thiol-disulfide isomerase/thioredoxin